MKIPSGRIHKLVYELHDGKPRGGTEKEREFIRPYYEKALRMQNKDSHIISMSGKIARMLKEENPNYFK